MIVLHRHKKEKDLIPNFVKEIEVRTYGISKISFLKLN